MGINIILFLFFIIWIGYFTILHFELEEEQLKIYNSLSYFLNNSVGVKILLTLMTIINIIFIASIIDLILAVPSVVFASLANYNDIIINKPKWCNSFSLADYYYDYLLILDDLKQKELKYPCAQLI